MFTLTKPIFFRFLTLKPQGPLCDLELDVTMGSITEWLCSAPATRAPHVNPASLTLVFERQLAIDMTRCCGIECLDCFVRERGEDGRGSLAFARGHFECLFNGCVLTVLMSNANQTLKEISLMLRTKRHNQNVSW